MRAYELFEVVKTARFNHGKYLLVHALEPNKNDEYDGVVYFDQKQIDKLSNQNLQALKSDFIKLAVDHERSSLQKNMVRRDRVNSKDIKHAALDLNTAFTTTVFENEIPTAIRLGSDGGKLFVDVMTREYFEMGGAGADKDFKSVKDRAWNKRAKTAVYGVGASPNKLEQLGFEFHGVYGLTDEKSPDPDAFRRYSLDLVSYSDKKTSHSFPSITIAFGYNGDKAYTQDIRDESVQTFERIDPEIIATYNNPELHYDDGGTVNIYYRDGVYYGDTNEFDFERPNLQSLVDTLKKWGYTYHDYGEDLFGKVK